MARQLMVLTDTGMELFGTTDAIADEFVRSRGATRLDGATDAQRVELALAENRELALLCESGDPDGEPTSGQRLTLSDPATSERSVELAIGGLTKAPQLGVLVLRAGEVVDLGRDGYGHPAPGLTARSWASATTYSSRSRVREVCAAR